MTEPDEPLSPDPPRSPGTPDLPDLDVDPGQFFDEDERRPAAGAETEPRTEPPD